ncbi:hypothetical protein EPI10_020929 [Gossypium australe]|uniref:Uncharacterized protein n=1 Tax=Gossypium australe TaxID=47621 RepID=A0A5B6WH32_9ROSI|nr:hypothetical protein EPI10_020929 [Gossypium australe]
MKCWLWYLSMKNFVHINGKPELGLWVLDKKSIENQVVGHLSQLEMESSRQDDTDINERFIDKVIPSDQPSRIAVDPQNTLVYEYCQLSISRSLSQKCILAEEEKK